MGNAQQPTSCASPTRRAAAAGSAKSRLCGCWLEVATARRLYRGDQRGFSHTYIAGHGYRPERARSSNCAFSSASRAATWRCETPYNARTLPVTRVGVSSWFREGGALSRVAVATGGRAALRLLLRSRSAGFPRCLRAYAAHSRAAHSSFNSSSNFGFWPGGPARARAPAGR